MERPEKKNAGPEITQEDIRSANRWWKRLVAPRFRKLLQAKPLPRKD